MRSTISALLVSTLLVSACGDSRLNPFNWFGGSRSENLGAQDGAEVNPLIPEGNGLFGNARKTAPVYAGTPIEAVTALVIERVPGGAIIRASGRSGQSVYDVRLTPANEEETPVNGVLTYRLDAVRSPVTRNPAALIPLDVTVARKVTDQTLLGVNTIRVEGLQNAQVSRR